LVPVVQQQQTGQILDYTHQPLLYGHLVVDMVRVMLLPHQAAQVEGQEQQHQLLLVPELLVKEIMVVLLDPVAVVVVVVRLLLVHHIQEHPAQAAQVVREHLIQYLDQIRHMLVVVEVVVLSLRLSVA
jgi:hypothetical protein